MIGSTKVVAKHNIQQIKEFKKQKVKEVSWGNNREYAKTRNLSVHQGG
jgi:hypothetical protein